MGIRDNVVSHGLGERLIEARLRLLLSLWVDRFIIMKGIGFGGFWVILNLLEYSWRKKCWISAKYLNFSLKYTTTS